MNRWQRLFEGIKTEIVAFLFFSVLLTIFRAVFLWIFQSQLATVPIEEILKSLWFGFRLSLKTVGIICLFGFILGTLVQTFVPKWPSLRLKQIIYSIATILLTFLFLGRIPFYKIFNSSYNMMLINGKHDDIGAIVNTAINENKEIKFHYAEWTVKKELKLKKNGAFYVVSPWALTWDDENYYLAHSFLAGLPVSDPG